MPGTIGQFQQSTFVSPVDGDPLNASVVLGNDNATRGKHNGHDADATIHVQSSTAAARPAAGTAQRVWMTTDTLRLAIDDGNSWDALTIDAGDVSSGTLGVARGGTGATAVPTNGQLLIGNGTGYTVASLTAGSGVTITPGAGTITIAAGAGSGDVTGPGSSTDNALARFDLATGKVIQNSSAILDDGGQLALTGPLNLSAGGSGQIVFPASQNASANANTLDDYEEGTFTPTANGVSFGGTNCRYTKIGNLVTVHGTVTWPINADVNSAQIKDLPFTVGSASTAATLFLQGASVQGVAQAGATLIAIYDSAGSIADNALLSSLSVTFSMTYAV